MDDDDSGSAMIRLFFLTIPFLFLASACSGPIETRITTHSAAALPKPKHFQYSAKPGQDSPSHAIARDLVSAALLDAGFKQKDAASILVSVAFADRPASIAVSAGDGPDVESIAEIKEREFLQSCEDQEHRLSVTIVNQVSGANIYTGTAAEYHCKAEFGDSLPHLVKAALSNLGKSVNQDKRTVVNTRAGIE